MFFTVGLVNGRLCALFFNFSIILKFFKPGLLLGVLAIGGMLLTLGAIFIQGMTGLFCLIGVSACMSLMFPTIYGIALQGLGEDAKFGAAGLIMAILGGSVMVARSPSSAITSGTWVKISLLPRPPP